MPRKSLRQASKEALKQMQLLSESAYDENEDESMDPTETFEIPSEEDEVEEVEGPPKKKYRLSNRKSGDGQDREVPVLKNVNMEELLSLDAWIEDLSEVQKAARFKLEQEYKELNSKIEQVTKSAEVIFQGEVHSAFELENSVPPLVYTTPDLKKKPAPAKTKATSAPKQSLLIQTNKSNSTTNSYQLVMDPRLGLIVGTVTPTTPPSPALPAPLTQSPAAQIPAIVPPRTRLRGRPPLHAAATPPLQQTTPPPKITKITSQPAASSAVTPRPAITTRPAVTTRPAESSSVGGISSKGSQNKASTAKASSTVVDLTAEENAGRPAADSKEVAFNKLQGKTFPSLVVVARPHLSVKDITGGDRTKLDAKVKSVLMYVPTKFTEWLIQQGLVRSEQVCVNHPSTKLKLGMYSDVSKFPYSGGYVWISECCPSRFVSVFSGSLFEGSSHPPSVILKLIYHWACQTNVQNVVQWVKVDNLYVKGINTFLRSICTAALHTHIKLLGGPGKRVEVGVISLGTTTQDGLQRQVKVEVLGILESEPKHIRLRAIEPLAESDWNYKKRFAKILEPLLDWVHKDSLIVTDLTVDKQTLIAMGFMNIQQSTSGDTRSGNQTIMEYLRRIVPRMFQNTLSLLSRQIIQQFLDELIWREWYGTTAAQCFDNILLHIAEQTRTDLGESLIVRLNKIAANPFKNWSFKTMPLPKTTNSKPTNQLPVEQTPSPQNDASVKKTINRQKKIMDVTPDSFSPERTARAISPDVPEQLVPLENYYYGTIYVVEASTNIKLTWNIKCSMCKSHFSNNIKLMGHLFTHAHNVTGNVYQCQYCLSSVGTQEGLTKHIATSHPVETRFMEGFVCIICEQRFANTFSLGKHLSKEHVPSELPYQCGTCSHRCSSHRQAIDHFYTKHESGSTIQCPFCLKSTTIASSGRILSQNLNFFLQHLQKHQKKALARKCPKCALWFINKDTLKEHQVNMHTSQRHKTGLVPWAAPRNGIMVPKSKTDKQVWEDNEREVDVSNITIKVPSRLLCKECKTPIKSQGHFQSLGGCTNQNCQYETCCKNAMDNHITICKDLNASLPIFTLPKEMFCVCGYSDNDGNTLAKHLAQCERKSAYPSAEIAKGAIKTHSMLDVLGLVRRPEEPTKSSPPVVDVIDLDDDKEEASQEKEEKKIAKKSTKKKRKAEEVVEVEVAEKRRKSTLKTRSQQSSEDGNETQSQTSNKEDSSDDVQVIEAAVENKVDNSKKLKKTKLEKKKALVHTENVQITSPKELQETTNVENETDVTIIEDADTSQEDVDMEADVTVIENINEKQSEVKEPDETLNNLTEVDSLKEELKENAKKSESTEQNKEEILNEGRDVQTDNIQNEPSKDSKIESLVEDSLNESLIAMEQIDMDQLQECEEDELQKDGLASQHDELENEKITEEVEMVQEGDLEQNDKPQIENHETDILDNGQKADATEEVVESSESNVDAETSEMDATVLEETNMEETNYGTSKNSIQTSNIEEPQPGESIESQSSEGIAVESVESVKSSEEMEQQDIDLELEKESEIVEFCEQNQEVKQTAKEAAAISEESEQDLSQTEQEPIQINENSEVSHQDPSRVELDQEELDYEHDREQSSPELEEEIPDNDFEEVSKQNDLDEGLCGTASELPDIEEDISQSEEQQENVEQTMSEIAGTDALQQETEEREQEAEPEVDVPGHAIQESDIANQSEDAAQKLDDVVQESEGTVHESEDVADESEDVVYETEDALSETDDAAHGSEDLVQESEDVVDESEDVVDESEDVVDESEEVVDESEDVVDESEDVVDGSKDVVDESEDVVDESENVVHESEDVVHESEVVVQEAGDVAYDPEDVIRDSEDVEDESEDVFHDSEDVVLEAEDVVSESEDVVSESEDVIHESEDRVPESEDVVPESEDAVPESENVVYDSEDVHEPGTMQLGMEDAALEAEVEEFADKSLKESGESLPELDVSQEADDSQQFEAAEEPEKHFEGEELPEDEENEVEREFEEFSQENTKTDKLSELLENTGGDDQEEAEEIPSQSQDVDSDNETVSKLHETDTLQPLDEMTTSEHNSVELPEDLDSAHEPILSPALIQENDEEDNKSLDLLCDSNSKVSSQSSEIVNSPIDVEENIENIQKELFGYQPKQVELIDKDAMDVDLPDIFAELGQNNTIEGTSIDNTAFDSRMVVDNTCFDNDMTGLETSEDNTKMLEEFIESIQTDTI